MPEPAWYVVVDDTDPRISYTGSWTLEPAGEKDGPVWTSMFGPTWNGTLHKASASSAETASFSFPFNGTYFIVFGSYIRDSSHQLASWRCSVDGKEIEPKKLTDGFRNLQRFCDGEVAGEGEHMLTVNVTFPAGGEFLLDQIHFTPPTEPTVGEVIKYQESDPHLVYTPPENWGKGEGASRATLITGTTMSIDFTGVGFKAWGPVNSSTSNSATYTVDDGPPVDFMLKTSSGTVYHQEVFSVSNLDPGHHKVTVNFTGNNSQGTPLAIDFVHVLLSPDPSQHSSTSSDIPVGVIVGGVMGGLVAVALIIVLAFCYSRRRVHKRDSTLDMSVDHFLPPSSLSSSPPHPTDPSYQSISASSSEYTDTSPIIYAEPTRKGYVMRPNRGFQLHQPLEAPQEPQIRHHTDSGMRLGLPPPVIDVPPQYTAQ